MLLEKVENAFKMYTGIMKIENLQKIAFNLPDTEDGETLAGVSMIRNPSLRQMSKLFCNFT